MTRDFLKLKNFDETYQVPYELKTGNFDMAEKFKKVAPAKIEHLRLEGIEEDKISQRKRLKSDIILNLPYLFYSLIILGVHVVLIRRTKEA